MGIEISSFLKSYEIKDIFDIINRINNKYKTVSSRSLHGPFMDLYPASQDPKIIEIVKNRFLEAYEISRVLNVKNLVYHSGYIPTLYASDEWLINSVKFWKEFLDNLDDRIEIHIENVYEIDYQLIKRLVNEVDKSFFSVCLDIGHANINSYQNLEKWIIGLNDTIKYVSINNNYGVTDTHYFLGEGNINMLKILNLLERYSPDAIWSLNMNVENVQESIEWLKKHEFIG